MTTNATATVIVRRLEVRSSTHGCYAVIDSQTGECLFDGLGSKTEALHWIANRKESNW